MGVESCSVQAVRINTSLPFPADITVRMHNPNNIVFDKMIFIFSNRPGRILIIFQQLYI